MVSVLFRLHVTHDYYIDSLMSLLSGNFQNFEILILNTSGVALPKEIAELGNIRNIEISDRFRIGEILNIGIRNSKGDYVSVFDSDDLAMPNLISEQINCMTQNPNVGFLSAAARIIGSNSRGKLQINSLLSPTSNNAQLMQALLFKNPIVHSTVMFRKSIFCDNHSWYSKKSNSAEDFELWTKLVSKVAYLGINKVLVDYRIHPEQTINLKRKELESKVNKTRLVYAIKVFFRYPEYRNQALLAIKHGLKVSCLSMKVSKLSKDF